MTRPSGNSAFPSPSQTWRRQSLTKAQIIAKQVTNAAAKGDRKSTKLLMESLDKRSRIDALLEVSRRSRPGDAGIDPSTASASAGGARFCHLDALTTSVRKRARPPFRLRCQPAAHPSAADGVSGLDGRPSALHRQCPAGGRPEDGLTEAKRNGFLFLEEAASLTDILNIRQQGTRLGNWLTKEQARELLTVPNRSTIKGKRDYAILALLVGCALRRRELASLTVEEIQLRENRWVIADLRGKGGRVRTVAVPLWVKHGINAWQAAGKVEGGPLLRSITKGGKVGESLSAWAIWAVVAEAAKQIGIENFGAHGFRRTCAKLCRKAGGDLEQIKFLLGHSSIQTTERYLGSEHDIAAAVNDTNGSERQSWFPTC